jgi:hypothetical protein
MAHNPVRWFEIYVQDMPRAKKFYESVFGVTLERLGEELDGNLEMWSFPGIMDQMGTPGALVRAPGVPSGGNSTIVYFACEDCAVEANRAVTAGGKIDRDKMSIGQYGYVALVYDTEGNMIGLHSMS